MAKGSGGKAFVEGYRVGGKTGTAQKASGGRYLENNYILSFIGFAPADDPELVVYVAVDNPKGTVQFGSAVAAPIVGAIMGDSLRALGVEPRKDQIDKVYKYPENPLIEVPDLVGHTKKDISEMFINLKIDSSGSGDTVIKQSPEPGTKVKEGSTILVQFN